MAEYDRQTLNARAGSALAIDEGLRSYMLRVYNYMGLGLVVTGLVAYFTSQWAMASEANAQLLYGSPLAWVIMLASATFGATGVLLPLRLSHLGASSAEIGLVFVVASAIEAVLSPRAGRIVDRRGPYLTIKIGRAHV